MLVEVPDEHANARLEMATNKSIQRAAEVYKMFDVEVVGMESSFTKPTKEESMRLVPRKIHFGVEVYPCCSKVKTAPRGRIVNDWAQVTCVQCLKKKEASLQAALFP
jgi:hypothetical protein